MVRKRLNRVSSSPFEFLVSLVCVVYGAASLVAGRPVTSNAMDDNFPLALIYGWSVMMIVGGCLTVAGVLMAHARVQMSGSLLLATPLSVYGVLLLAVYGFAQSFAPLAMLAFGASFAAKAWSFHSVIRKSRIIGAPEGGAGA